jgi:transaldolase
VASWTNPRSIARDEETEEEVMERLIRLHEELGQSPWLDNLKRGYLTSGQLAELRDGGIRGLTSNPTIFQKAIEGSADYDEQFRALVASAGPVLSTYWALVRQDIEGALSVFRPLYDASDGRDGFVSVEVAPDLAHDTDGTIRAARDLHRSIAAPNLLVKIPATAEGVPAIRQMIAEGRSINVTLIFSLARYAEVMEAYLSGLEEYLGHEGGEASRVASVASFFISRVDTETDRRLEAIGTPEALARRGRAAVAQGKLAYQLFRTTFSGPRWEALAARGARFQRPLWASTSTKNPAYPDTLYVDNLIGPDSVNTMPDETIEAFVDHGTLARTIDTGVDEAEATWAALAEVGVDMDDVAETLEREGVASFQKSFDQLLDALTAKAAELGG